MNSTLAIDAEGLAKSFGTATAVAGVDLAVPAGTTYGVLGPNGAGKTTTLRMLSTLLRPDAGHARVFGHDIRAEPALVRARIGLTGQFAAVDEELTGAENLVLFGRLLGFSRRDARRRAGDLLAAFDLTDAADRRLKAYSGGMRRRVDLAASLVLPPDLLFLDEPTAGLDPRSRGQLWDLVREVVAAGTTVLLTTQYLEEADRLADRIAVIDHGRVIAEGTPADVKSSIGSGAVHVRLREPSQRGLAEVVLARVLDVPVRQDTDPAVLMASVPDTARAGHALTALTESGIDFVDFSVGQPSLDEVFLALTGNTTQEATV